MRPTEKHIFLPDDVLTILNPVIPANFFVVNTDTLLMKLGNGIDTWSDLRDMYGNTIVGKNVQTSRNPNDCELLVFCSSEDKWIFRLAGCKLTETECESMISTVYPLLAVIVELDDDTNLPTGRVKINDGATAFGLIPWLAPNTPPSVTLPLMDGTATIGSSILYSREDHVHPSDTSRSAVGHIHDADDITDNVVVGPSTSVDGNIPAFSGTGGDVLVDSGNNIDDLIQQSLLYAIALGG